MKTSFLVQFSEQWMDFLALKSLQLCVTNATKLVTWCKALIAISSVITSPFVADSYEPFVAVWHHRMQLVIV